MLQDNTQDPIWQPRCSSVLQSFAAVDQLIRAHRSEGEVVSEPYSDSHFKHLTEALQQTLSQSKEILLYGDYDVDGSMSCVLWIWFFRHIGFNTFRYYIPSRQGSGYGVHQEVLERFHNKQPMDMLITMDTGITAKKEARWCAEQGIISVITDHHDIIEEQLPQHGYVLNPKLGNISGYHNLCGCGVTLLLISSVASKLSVDLSAWLPDALAVTALATVCDMMPLQGDNRRLVRRGLAAFQHSSRPVLKALREYAARPSHSHQALSSEDFAFRIGPLLNAVGRLADASIIVSTFTEDHHPQTLDRNIQKIQGYLVERRDIEAKVLAEAQELAKHMLTHYPHTPILFIGKPHWHPGVLGLIAGRMVELYRKPTWVYTAAEEGALMRGSVRSFSENDRGETLCVTEAMEQARQLFVRFGGHRVAAGFSFEAHQKEAITRHLISYGEAVRRKYPELWRGQIIYDAPLHPSLLTLELWQVIQGCEPYGVGYEKPLFLIEGSIKGLRFYPSRKTGQLEHTALFIQTGKHTSLRVMFFRKLLEHLKEKTDARIQCLIQVSSSWFQGQQKMDCIGVAHRLVEDQPQDTHHCMS